MLLGLAVQNHSDSVFVIINLSDFWNALCLYVLLPLDYNCNFCCICFKFTYLHVSHLAKDQPFVKLVKPGRWTELNSVKFWNLIPPFSPVIALLIWRHNDNLFAMQSWYQNVCNFAKWRNQNWFTWAYSGKHFLCQFFFFLNLGNYTCSGTVTKFIMILMFTPII